MLVFIPTFAYHFYNYIDMDFNNLELSAVLKAGKCMVLADGKVEDEEMKVLTLGMAEFGVTPDHLKILLALSDAMTPATMLATLAALDDSQKKFVCGFLATIMVCDGDVDDAEVKLWQLTSYLAGFPTMSMAEAVDYWRTH